jgi:hypothetical protein
MNASSNQPMQPNFLVRVLSRFTASFKRGINWLAAGVQSRPVTQFKDGIQDAAKLAVGIHYVFSLIEDTIPENSNFYTGFTITKYTMAGITLLTTASVAYLKSHSKAVLSEKVISLELKLIEIDKAVNRAEQLAAREQELLLEAGYHLENNLLHYFQNEFEHQAHTPKSKNCLQAASQAKSMVMLRAGCHGAVTALSVQYIMDLGLNIIPVTIGYEVIRYTFLGISFCVSSWDEHSAITAGINNKAKLAELEVNLAVTDQKIKYIEQLLGPKEKLQTIAEYATQTVENAIPVIIQEDHLSELNLIPKPWHERNSVCKTALYTKFFLQGAMQGSGLHNLAAITLPFIPPAKFIVGVSASLLSTALYYKKNNTAHAYQQQALNLDVSLAKMHVSLELAENIMQLESLVVASEQPSPPTFAMDDLADEDSLLTNDFLAMNYFPENNLVLTHANNNCQFFSLQNSTRILPSIQSTTGSDPRIAI